MDFVSRLLIRLRNNPVTMLFSATGLAQMVLFGSSLLLTRLYSPSDFGLFGLAMAVASVLSVMVTGRFELAIMLPEDSAAAINVAILGAVCTFCGSTAVLFLLAILPADYLARLGIAGLHRLVYFIPLLVMLQSFYQILYFWLNRHKQYGRMANTKVQLVSIAAIVAIGAGFTKIFEGGLIISQIAAYALVIVWIVGRIWPDLSELLANVSWATLSSQAKRYIDFPKYLIFAHLLMALSAQLPVIMLSFIANSAVAGYFTLTQRVLGAPVQLISRSVADIIREKFSAAFRERRDCAAMFDTYLKYLAAVALLPFILFSAWGPELFAQAFGSKWIVSGIYARLLAFMVFMQIIANPLSVMYSIAEQQKSELYLQTTRVATCFLSIWIGFYSFGRAEMSILFFGAVMSCIYLFMIFQTRSFANRGYC